MQGNIRGNRQKLKNDCIVMIGPDHKSKGGIASVIASYRNAGFFEKWPVVFLPTHVEGNKLDKLVCAIKAICRFANLLICRKAGALHVHVARRNSFWRKAIFMQLAFIANCPVLIHLHSGGFPAFYNQECGALQKWLIRHFLGRALALIVLTESWQDAYVDFMPNQLLVLPNFVELAPLKSASKENPYTLLFLGRLTHEKGVFDLLQAVSILVKNNYPDLIVRLGGEGFSDEIESILNNLNILNNVKFEGWVEGEKKANLLNDNSIFVLPSYVEGLPMGVLEAMSNCLPVVVTRVGGLPDMITDGVNGLMIEPGDIAGLVTQLDRLLSDSKLRNQLAMAGRKCIEDRYCANAVIPILENLYSSLGIEPYPS